MFILLYADDIILGFKGKGVVAIFDAKTAINELSIFGYHSGLKVNPSKSYVLYKSTLLATPKTVAGLEVKKKLKYLGVWIGHITADEAYAIPLQKMIQRANYIRFLPLSLKEKAEMVMIWLIPCLYLTARSYEPTKDVESQLQNIQSIALGTNSWHLTKHILALGKKQGGVGLAPMGSYAAWLHSHTFVQLVKSPHTLLQQEVECSRAWAKKNAIIATESTLPFFQFAPINILRPTFLQKTMLAYSRSRKHEAIPPSPPSVFIGSMPLWHNVLFKNDSGHTYFSRKMLQKNRNTYSSVVAENGVEPTLFEGMPQQWLNIYCNVIRDIDAFLYNPPVAVPSSISIEQWVPGWTKKVMLLHMQTGLRPEQRRTEEVWKAFSKLKLPAGDYDFIRRTLWQKLPVGDRIHVRGAPRICPFDGLIEDHKHVTTQSCLYLQLASNILTAIFGPVKLSDGTICELGYIIDRYPEYSLVTTQGLALWAALKCSWSCRNDLRFKGQRPTYHSFVAIWRARLEVNAKTFDCKKRSLTFDYTAASVAPKRHPESPSNNRGEKL